jgi:hypothetical protein
MHLDSGFAFPAYYRPKHLRHWVTHRMKDNMSHSIDVVETTVHLRATPEAVWHAILTFEEVPKRPTLLLRTLLPYPLRTEGDKTRVGADILCTYRRGNLVKRILSVQPPNLLQFEIIQQHLGVEDRITLLGGSYKIDLSGDESDIALTTQYLGHLSPRFLWRPLERSLAHHFHHHILNAMRASLVLPDPAVCTTSP